MGYCVGALELADVFLREVEQAIYIISGNRNALCQLLDAGITRRTVDFVNQRRLGYFPDQGMFSSAGTDYQYFHFFLRSTVGFIIRYMRELVKGLIRVQS